MAVSCGLSDTETGWEISVLPSSVRLDPVTNEIIDHRFDAVTQENTGKSNLLEKNWIYDGEQVTLHAARGEYVSFQLVVTNHAESTLKGINIEMAPFMGSQTRIDIGPEFFLEWAVEVKTLSTGYPKASLGTGWYPDALIPLECLQTGPEKPNRLIYPLSLPDFRNRIDNQRYCVIWVDQFVPFERTKAAPGITAAKSGLRSTGARKKSRLR